ncbi:MAG TPA: glycosyltransferase [Bacteroidales bacterium]
MTVKLKQQIDYYLKRIAQFLILKSSEINHLGLAKGKLGIAIFLYHYAKLANEDTYREIADELIEDVYQKAKTIKTLDFYNGLTGIGWGIEYLIRNGFIEADSDTTFAEIDHLLLQRITSGINFYELTDYLLYFQSRLKNSQDYQYKGRKGFLTDEAVLNILKDCEQFLDLHANQKKSHGLDTFRSIFLFLSALKKMGFFPDRTERILNCIQPYLNKDAEHFEGVGIDGAALLAGEQLIYYSLSETSPEYNNLNNTIVNLLQDEENWSTIINEEKVGLRGLAGIGTFLSNHSDIKPLQKELKIDDKQMSYVFLVVFNFSGMRTYSDLLSYYLSLQSNLKVALVFESKNYKEISIEKVKNIDYIYIPARKSLGTPFEKRVAQLLFLKYGYLRKVLFHFNDESQYKLSKEIKGLFKCPIVYTKQYLPGVFSYFDKGFECDIKKAIANWYFLEDTLALTDRIIVSNEFTKRILERLYGAEGSKVKVIRNGCKKPVESLLKKEEIKEKLGFNAKDKIILFVGRLDARKGLDCLIKAFERIASKHCNLRLVIVGGGKFEEYFSCIKSYYGRIHFIGQVDEEKLKHFYQIADIGAVPSRFEQGSIVTIEMMLRGTPVIISDVPGFNEMITDGKDGLICEVVPDKTNELLEPDEIDLAELISKICVDETLANYLSKNAIFSSESTFSLEKMGKETLNVYNELFV